MPIEVTMPKLSPTMETGVIAHWLVKVGDQVKEGDVLADIETDKATMQMKSYDDGVIVHIDHAAGAEVALGQRVMVLAKKGEDPKQVVASLAGASAGAGSAVAPKRQPAMAGAATKAASENGQKEETAEAEAQVGRVKASPLARRMAETSRVDLNKIRGTGPGGRIIRRDIEAFLQGTTIPMPEAASELLPVAPAPAAQEAARPAAPPAPPAAAQTPAPAAPPVRYTPAAALAAQRIPHSRMRKTIAARMSQAKQTAPEIHVTVDIRVDKLIAVREDLNRQLAAEKLRLSLGDFVTKAVAIAPAQASGSERELRARCHRPPRRGESRHCRGSRRGAHCAGTASSRHPGPGGYQRQTEALAAAARSNSLSTDQLTGGTFTISNLGMYGVSQFDAILNLPEVGILAVAAAEKRPVVEGDKLVPGTLLSVTLTADHRAVDGAMAADFLRTLKGLLEEPAMMLL